MALTPYTDVDQVRAAIGVSSDDISDDTLNLKLYEVAMGAALRSVGPTFKTDLDALIAGTPTADQQHLIDLAGLYATYAVALQLVTSAPLFALKEMKDDRTSDIRVDDPFKNLRENIQATMAYVLSKLTDAYLDLFPAAEVLGTATPISGAAAGLAVDPVTG